MLLALHRRAFAPSCRRCLSSTTVVSPPPGPPLPPPLPQTARPPLLDHLEMLINFRGPMTVAEFMNIALLHPQHGYYCRRTGVDDDGVDDVFGRTGDFTTAPEISQLFGEMVGVWCVATWQQLGLSLIHI